MRVLTGRAGRQAGLIEEMMDDAMESADADDVDEEADEEVDKVLTEIMTGPPWPRPLALAAVPGTAWRPSWPLPSRPTSTHAAVVTASD
jgi:hypothetical protein